MVNVNKLKVGSNVHYQPEHYKEQNKFENGIVKEIRYPYGVWVVYNCNGEWHRFKEFTGCKTNINDLYYGWKNSKGDIMKYSLKYVGRFIEVRETNGWEWVARKNVKDIVSIMAITDNKQVVLIEQFRIPINNRIIESPAGLVDEGETLLQAAKRELMEETGYESNTWTSLYANAPHSAGLSNETSNKFVAHDCIKTENGGGIDNENIVTHLVDISDVPKFLLDKEVEGIMVDPKIITGIFWYNYWNK